MDKLRKIKSLLADIGMPPAQQSDLCALTILAMAGLKEIGSFASATNNWIRIHDVIAFINSNYIAKYAENSRETFRKQAMHHFRTAALIEDNGKATNSPNYRYRLTDEFLKVIQETKKTKEDNSDNDALKEFLSCHERLIDTYASKKTMRKMPVRMNEKDFTFSPGSHNRLQKAILEEFAPRFAPGSECLYVGDTTHRDMVKNEMKLRELGFDITLHDKMPGSDDVDDGISGLTVISSIQAGDDLYLLNGRYREGSQYGLWIVLCHAVRLSVQINGVS